MSLIFAKIFARTQYFFHEVFKIDLPGFGIVVSQIKRDYVLNVGDIKIYFNHKIARAYGRLIAGIWNEPETHLFLKNVIRNIDFRVNFIDVGANVGEFVLDMARYKSINLVFAFEPIYEACKSIQLSCLINDFKHVKVFNQVLSENRKPTEFFYDKKYPTSSNIFKGQGEKNIFNSTTLDIQFSDVKEPTIILIDVEGAELMVMKGGVNFIRNNYPLIIFEYNVISKKHFSLKDVQTLLGQDYEIYRLKANGWLDKKYDNIWNTVAVNSKSLFFPVIKSLIK